jgi:hypothetical protein
MKLNKSPGLDGLTVEFYRAFSKEKSDDSYQDIKDPPF